MITLIAKLTGNRRDVETLSPKALLIDIEGFDREHCWVKITSELAAIQPQGHKKPILVKIEADIQEYKARGNIDSVTLTILSIQKIKKGSTI